MNAATTRLGFRLAAAVGVVLCGSATLGTVCAFPGVQISIAASRAQGAHVTATGPACDGDVQCNTPSANTPLGCTVRAVREGACHIEITFSSGAPAVTRDVVFRGYSGCCNGLYPDDGNGSLRVEELPAGDAGSDSAMDGDGVDAPANGG